MLIKIIRVLGPIFISLISIAAVFVLQFHNLLYDSGFSGPITAKIISLPTILEDQFYDFRMKMNLSGQKEERLVLADIDEDSIKSIGRFPWSRTVWAKLLDKLSLYKAKVVAFDVVLSESERSYEGQNPDDDLAKAITRFGENGGKVILPYSLTSTYSYDDEISFKELPEEMYNFILDTKMAGERGIIPSRISNSTFPIDKLKDKAQGLSYIGAVEDPDGLFRHYQLIANIDTLYFPSYSLQAYEFFTDDKTSTSINSSGEAIVHSKTGDLELNYKGETKVRWIGGRESFPAVSIDKILQSNPETDTEMRKLLEEKLIFVGPTAFGAHDLRHTPVDHKLPGVYFHMNMTNMLLNGHFFQSISNSIYWSWGLLLCITIFMVLIGLMHNAILELLLTILASAILFAVDYYYFIPNGHQVALFFLLFCLLGTYSFNTMFNFYLSSKDKQFLKNAFGNYISPELIDEMYKSGKHPTLGGDVGVRTAFFTDIQGFSSFSEKLSATKLVALLNEYLTAMTDLLLSEKGTLDKYEGDAIIAFFGAPLPLEDHAERACRTAIKMQKSLLELRKKWVSEEGKWPTIVHDMRMRIGINSGEIVTGNMGSKSRMNYTMMGDSVNLSARLESSAKQYGIFNHISLATLELADKDRQIFLARKLDKIRVVGKSEPVITYELMDIKSEASENLLMLHKTFEEALALFERKEFEEAEKKFNESLQLEFQRFPELKEKPNPSKIYLARCQEFRKNPPEENWDGVFDLLEK